MTGGKGSLGISYHVKGLMDFPVEIDIPGKFSIYNSLTLLPSAVILRFPKKTSSAL